MHKRGLILLTVEQKPMFFHTAQFGWESLQNPSHIPHEVGQYIDTGTELYVFKKLHRPL